MLRDDLVSQAEDVVNACRSAGRKIAVAESCTGGLVAASLTAVAGASDIFDRGFVTYSNAAKAALLDVPDALLASAGAVSEAVARAMAEGALSRSEAHIAVAVTGIAGPGGATAAKPVGLVHLAIAGRDAPTRHEKYVFPGDRTAVRHAAVAAALSMLQRACGEGSASGAP